jgi:hypothetical protein
MSSLLHIPATLLCRKSSLYALERRLGGLQSQPGYASEQENPTTVFVCILLYIHHIKKMFMIKVVGLNEMYTLYHTTVFLYNEPFLRK